MNTELGAKRLELLRELMPTATVIALLVNPTSRFITETMLKDMQSAARPLGLQLQILQASTERDFEMVFATLAQLRARALVIAPDAFFISQSAELGALTLRHSVPAITQFREFAAGGGLMSYGGSFTDAARQAGVHRPNSQRRQASRSSDRSDREGGADHQPKDRQGDWPRPAGDRARPRRRGDRIM